MTIGFSPFLTADVDDSFGFAAQRSAGIGESESGDNGILPARLELIRHRVLGGYYSTPAMTTKLARQLLERGVLRDS